MKKSKYKNIRQKENGTWEYRKMVNGHRVSICADTLQALQRKVKEQEKESQFADRRNAKKITLDELYNAWIKTKKGLKPITYQRYVATYKNLIKPVFGNKLVTHIKHSDVTSFYISLATEDNKARGTIEDTNSIFKMIMEVAVNDEVITRNPCINATDAAKKIAREPKQKASLTDQQIEELTKFIKNSETYGRWYGIVLFALETGMRINEICSLQNSDVDLENGWVNVNKTLSGFPDSNSDKRKHIYVIQTPKTRTSVRKVPLSKKAKEAVLFERKRLEKEKIKCKATVVGGTGFKGKTFNDFVFLNRFGEFHKEGGVARALIRIVDAYNESEDKLKLPHITPHVARHTLATRMNEHNVNEKAICSMLGHSSSTITKNVYIHANDDFVLESMRKYEEESGESE